MTDLDTDTLLLLHTTLARALYASPLGADHAWAADATRSLAAVERALGWDDDEYANGCGECLCCPCGIAGCSDCPPGVAAAPDTGSMGLHAPMVHGVSRTRAVVTRSLTRGRSRFGATRDIPDLKRRAHRRHRRAWKRWCADPDGRREPSLRFLTSWEVW